MVETKFVIAQILMNFKLTLNEKTDQPMVLNPRTVAVEALNGVWLNFEELN